jgi:imidazolonepropionase-like amidohydrolase
MADAGVDFIKVYAGFDGSHLTALVAAARVRGLGVAGHAQEGLPLAEQAAMGLVSVEHLDFSTFAECVPDATAYFDRVIAARFRGSGESIPAIMLAFAEAADTPACHDAMRAAAQAGLVLTPTMVAGFLPPERAAAAAATLPAWARDNCVLYRQQFAGLDMAGQAQLLLAGRLMLGILIDAGVPILAGSDSPAFCAAAGAGLHEELALLASAGLPPLAVLQSATLLPGRRFGGAVQPGRIRTDGPADLVLLDGNPLIDLTAYTRPVGLYDGRVWRDADALAALRRAQSM